MEFIKGYRKFLHYRRHLLPMAFAVLAFLVALVEVSRMSGIISNCAHFISSPLVFSFFCLVPALAILESHRVSVNRILMLFCVVGAMSLILNYKTLNYMPVLRFCFFCGMMCLFSPLVCNASLSRFRHYLWSCALLLCRVGIILSLLLYVVTALTGEWGNLYLIFSHPMTLSMVAAIVAVVDSWQIAMAKKGQHVAKTVFDIFSFIVAVVLMVWGGSRGAILGFAIAELYLVFLLFRNRYGIARLLIALVASFAIVLAIGGPLTRKVELKFEIGRENNSLIFSRQQLWQSRLEEFADSPIFGIGFANATRFSTLYDNQIVLAPSADMTEEPGSSWLSVLSNTGIVGFAIMAFWNLYLFRAIRLRRRNGDLSAICHGALLLLLLVQGSFEGWVLYAGSLFFFLYWVLSSQILKPRSLQPSNRLP